MGASCDAASVHFGPTICRADILVTVCVLHVASVGRTEDRRRSGRVAVLSKPRRRRSRAVQLHQADGARDTHAVRKTAAGRQRQSYRDDLLR